MPPCGNRSNAPGKTTTPSFDLAAGNYKTTATHWEFRASIADWNGVVRMSIIIYPKTTGSTYVDDIYPTNTP